MPSPVTIDSAGQPMRLYDAVPEGDARGAMVVVQEAFGVNGHIEDVCRRFTAAGYRAVAPHLFHRTGDAVVDYDNLAEVMPHLGELSAEGLSDDLDATLGYLHERGFADGQIGIVGFCMGGSVVVFVAERHALGAGVTFYGGGVTAGRFGVPPLVELAPNLKTPWLGLFGEEDQGIPLDQVEALTAAAAGSAVDTEVATYAGAGHGFHCDARDSYHEPSAKEAWQLTLDWFDTHLAKV